MRKTGLTPDVRRVERRTRRETPARSAASAGSSYAAALRLLAARELSTVQLRTRLARRGYDAAEIEETIIRLTEERALDDTRVAEAIARTQTRVKRRGRMRVRQEIERAGISKDIARQALDHVFAEVDDQALIETALRKRLRDGQSIRDEREFAGLYRYLVSQGFSSEQALDILRRRRAHRDSAD